MNSKYDEIIKQGKFASEEHRLSLALVYVAALVGYQRDKFYKQHGFSTPQFRLLYVLNHEFGGKANIKDVRIFMIDIKPDMSRLTDRLQKSGMLIKTSSTKGGRNEMLTITQEGRNAIEQIVKGFSELLMPVNELNAEEQRQLLYLLEKIHLAFAK